MGYYYAERFSLYNWCFGLASTLKTSLSNEQIGYFLYGVFCVQQRANNIIQLQDGVDGTDNDMKNFTFCTFTADNLNKDEKYVASERAVKTKTRSEATIIITSSLRSSPFAPRHSLSVLLSLL